MDAPQRSKGVTSINTKKEEGEKKKGRK